MKKPNWAVPKEINHPVPWTFPTRLRRLSLHGKILALLLNYHHTLQMNQSRSESHPRIDCHIKENREMKGSSLTISIFKSRRRSWFLTARRKHAVNRYNVVSVLKQRQRHTSGTYNEIETNFIDIQSIDEMRRSFFTNAIVLNIQCC